MNPLTEVLQKADKRRVAIGHFNFSELVVLQAVVEAVSELGVPVVSAEHAGRRRTRNLSECGSSCPRRFLCFLDRGRLRHPSARRF
jgi:fructose/tagatose bisphosphate aldolase